MSPEEGAFWTLLLIGGWLTLLLVINAGLAALGVDDRWNDE